MFVAIDLIGDPSQIVPWLASPVILDSQGVGAAWLMGVKGGDKHKVRTGEVVVDGMEGGGVR